MKKNRLMRLAAVLLVLTLMTSCFVGGTFAKYVTTDSASDTARVAKWGIEVLASGNLFGEDYNPNSSADSVDDDVIGTVTTSVSSNNTDNIVAPGTKNDEGFTVAITGIPEVSYKVTAATGTDVTDVTEENEDIFLGAGTWGVMVKATGLNAASEIGDYYEESAANTFTKATTWVDGNDYYELHDVATVGADYYPINWTVTKGAHTDEELDGIATTKNLAVIAAEMVTDFNDMNDVNDVTGSEANDPANDAYVLTWEWPFDTTVDANSNSGADTILGNLMADTISDNYIVVKSVDTDKYTSALSDGADYNLDIVFNFEVTVEQTN